MLRKIVNSVILLAAIWLILSPYVFGYYDMTTAAGVASFLGLGVFVLAAFELLLPAFWEDVVTIFLGVIIAASPWLFGDFEYMSKLATESVETTGIVMVIFSILGITASLMQERSHQQMQH